MAISWRQSGLKGSPYLHTLFLLRIRRAQNVRVTRGGQRSPTRSALAGKNRRCSGCKQTAEGIAVKPLYTEADIDNLEVTGTARPAALRPRLPRHHICIPPSRGPSAGQYAGFNRAKESNAFYRRNLAAVRYFPSPSIRSVTHRYDSTIRVAGDVGESGVAIDTEGYEDSVRSHPAG